MNSFSVPPPTRRSQRIGQSNEPTAGIAGPSAPERMVSTLASAERERETAKGFLARQRHTAAFQQLVKSRMRAAPRAHGTRHLGKGRLVSVFEGLGCRISARRFLSSASSVDAGRAFLSTSAVLRKTESFGPFSCETQGIECSCSKFDGLRLVDGAWRRRLHFPPGV